MPPFFFSLSLDRLHILLFLFLESLLRLNRAPYGEVTSLPLHNTLQNSGLRTTMKVKE